MGITGFSVGVVIGSVVVLFLIIGGDGEILEFLVVFSVHLLELSGQAFVDVVPELLPLRFLSLTSSFVDSIRRGGGVAILSVWGEMWFFNGSGWWDLEGVMGILV